MVEIFEIILGAVTASVVGMMIFLFIKRSRPITEVLLCKDRNRTGETIRIQNDFAETMETDLDRKPAPLFFWKYRGGYAFHEGGRLIRRFFAREGSAYTKGLQGSELKCSLATALKAKVGEQFYNAIPEAQRMQIEDPTINVIVDLEEQMTPEGYDPLSSEDVLAEGDRKAARIFNKEMQEETVSKKSRLLDVLLGAMMSAALLLLAVVMGWIGAPAPR